MPSRISRGAGIAVAVVVFAGLAAVPTTGLFDHDQSGDVALYRDYGERVVHGSLPYRDFFMEYPPGALPAFVAPTPLHRSSYLPGFKLLMLACALGALLLAGAALPALRAEPERRFRALACLAAAPLLLGPVLTTHYDAWPSALTAAALALLLLDRPRLALAALGLAAAAKVYPLALAPLAVLYVGRRRGAREGWIAAAFGAGTLAAAVLPFAALGPGGMRFSLTWELKRPLQIESLGASLLLAAGRAGLYGVRASTGYNSRNLDGGAAHTVAIASGLALLVALAAVWILFARSSRDGEALVVAAAASVAAVVAFGKVLSPQYLVWLLPLVPLALGAEALVATVALVAACCLTQSLRAWPAPGDDASAWVLLVRNGLLVAVFALLLRELAGLRRRPSGAPDASARSGASPGGATGS